MRDLPDVLRGEMSESLSSIFANYYGREDQFAEHALAHFADVDNLEVFGNELFTRLYNDRKGLKGGIPALFETIVETSRRLRDARHIELALADTGSSGIVCGSLSYGPFFNVHGIRGIEQASDLDLIIVVGNSGQLSGIIDCLSNISGVDQKTVDHLRVRAKIFTELYDKEDTILSHKINLWKDADTLLSGTGLQSTYQVSMHFITRRTLEYILATSANELTRNDIGGKRTVRDYRDTYTDRVDLPRTFAGREYLVLPQNLSERKFSVVPPTQIVEEGWLRWVTAYLFDENDCYCPGFLQTILLPVSELHWDGLDVKSELTAFAQKFYNRYHSEQRIRPHALLRPSLTHVRMDAFAPHIIRRFDSGR